MGPVSARGNEPVFTRGNGPVSARGIGPVSARGNGPVSARGNGPVPGWRACPVPGLGIGPADGCGLGPAPSCGIGPVAARGKGPVSALGTLGIGPVSARCRGRDPVGGPVRCRAAGPAHFPAAGCTRRLPAGSGRFRHGAWARWHYAVASGGASGEVHPPRDCLSGPLSPVPCHGEPDIRRHTPICQFPADATRRHVRVTGSSACLCPKITDPVGPAAAGQGFMGWRFAGTWSRAPGRGFGVRGSGFGVRGSGFGVRGSGFGVRGSGFGVRGSGFGVRGSGLGFGVRGSGFGVGVRVRGSGFGFGVRGSGFGVRGSHRVHKVRAADTAAGPSRSD